MKESVKKFMEVVSSEGNDTIEKLQNADAESSTANNQARDQAGITQLSWQLSSR